MRRTVRLGPRFNYELFNHNIYNTVEERQVISEAVIRRIHEYKLTFVFQNIHAAIILMLVLHAKVARRLQDEEFAQSPIGLSSSLSLRRSNRLATFFPF